jgi:acetyl-CoA carboxylase biotin carboxylase subunit
MMKVLVANRGEIALRVIRTLKQMGLFSVAVYSDVDKNSPHVFAADEAVNLPGRLPIETYLDIDKVIEAIRKTQAQAVHPGYGFLSENASFRKRCDEEGVIFIGPPADAMRVLGDKLLARQTIVKAGVPVVPGSLDKGSTFDSLREDAKKAGFPVMLKACAGGGGKGMRLVQNEEELLPAFEGASREAMSAFGDASLYVEKFIENPRHIEVQILMDRYGEGVHLFERECSVQRRHQKVIEETPATKLSKAVRDEMCSVALRAGKAAGYECAGTVEFLVDKNENFYFLEMNTRIQVEHPITEMVVGVDICEAMIKLALGEKMFLKQEELSQRGNAIECRVYAEDPYKNFLPSPGKLFRYRRPNMPFVRVDDGVEENLEISQYYDPLFAKVVAWGENREQARRRMVCALKDFEVIGVMHNIPFLMAVLEHEEFVRGGYDTSLVERVTMPEEETIDKERVAASVVALLHSGANKQTANAQGTPRPSAWRMLGRTRR